MLTDKYTLTDNWCSHLFAKPYSGRIQKSGNGALVNFLRFPWTHIVKGIKTCTNDLITQRWKN